MIRQLLFAAVILVAMAVISQPSTAQAQEYGNRSAASNLDRFYHYPYVYYPQNYYNQDHFKSADNLYYRYPKEMRVPVYNRNWYNYYPTPRRYHFGHHFLTDVF